MNFLKAGSLNQQDIQKIFLEKNEIYFECFLLDHHEEQDLLEALKICLIELGKENIYAFVSYCYQEILNNAKKANTKRVYFEELNLSIYDPDQYREGMKSFKAVTFEQIDKYIKLQEEKNFYIHSSFIFENDIFTINVKNKSKICNDEILIINEKKKKARAFKTVDDALSIIMQNEEGAGLGIMISVLMLKKIGLSADYYNVISVEDETSATLTIPLSLITEDNIRTLSEHITKEINELPQFPERIIELQNKLSDPEVDLIKISILISQDPGLTAEIIRFSNTAIYSLPRRISSLLEAIKIIGLRGLRNIIYSYETKLILGKKYDMKKMQSIWDHSYKVGFFAFNFAKKSLSRDELEDIYIGGILHDLGKMLTFSLNPDLMEKIHYLCQEKGIPLRVIEEITSGFNHAMIGGMMARKWNFPDKLIVAIECHLDPEDVEDKYKKFIYCIYLANIMAREFPDYGEIYGEIEKNVLDYFNINSLDALENLAFELNSGFEEQKQGLAE